MALPFREQSWIWYTCAVCMIGARIISRGILFRSIKGLQIDDWIMGIFVTAAYTVLIVFSNKWQEFDSNLEPPGFDFSALGPEELARRVYGSKMAIVVEQLQVLVLWACKACLLIMYHRITRTALHYENIAIRILASYTALGFVTMEILYFGVWCQPFSNYFAVPSSSLECTTLMDHRITKAVFSISADLIMLCIALQMLVRSLLPIKRKIVLCGIFSLGLFLVAASILSCYYPLMQPYEHTWIFWYLRESSTAILIANLPFTWTILREIFELGQFDETSPPPAWAYHSARTAGGRRQAQLMSHETSATNQSYSPRIANRRTRSMPVESFNGAKLTKNSDQSEDTRMDWAREAIELDDFAPAMLRSAGNGMVRLDMDSGINGQTGGRPVSLGAFPQRTKFLSAVPKITQDGREKLSLDECRISAPSVAHFTLSSKRTSANSIVSLVDRPVSPVSSYSSAKVDFAGGGSDGLGVVSGGQVAAGGRSGRDRNGRLSVIG